MKQPTINQVNGRLKNSPVIQWYLDNSTDQARWTDNWRHRTWNYVQMQQDEAGNWNKPTDQRRQITPLGNWIYGAAATEFHRITGSDGSYNYERDNKSASITVPDSRGARWIEFIVTTRQDITGCQVTVECSALKVRDRYQLTGNKPFSETQPEEVFLTRLSRKYLHGPGLFRDIQILMRCNKKEALNWYRTWKREQQDNPDTVDIYRAWRQLFKKFKNLDIQDIELFTPEQLRAAYHSAPAYRGRRKASKAPSVFDMYERLSREYDDDEQLMAAAESEITADNTIWI